MNPSSDSRRHNITPPTCDPTKMTPQNQTVMLADNFPAKAYLLITHLTEAEPNVASFSSDGKSFEIYDQSIFAQKYLPQYFKHSNYGSFVRQLNLYGFNSSRLKNNSDVVVWTHDSFRPDRKELVKDIKRTKKTKITKPSHVHIDPRSPSPHSLSDDVSSENTANAAAKLRRTVSGVDQGWLESQFEALKQQNRFLLKQQNSFLEQNRFLEHKLDTLIVTLRVSPMPMEKVHVGEKRRRMSPVESSDQMDRGLESIYEEQKFFDDGDDYGIEPTPFEWDRKPPPPVIPETTRNPDFGARDDSMKRFVDIMLSEEEQEECKAGDGYGMGNNASAQSYAAAQSANAIGPENINTAATYPPKTFYEGTLDDELMEEAMNARLPNASIDTDGDYFSEFPEEPSAQLQADSHPNERVTIMTNRAVDKPDGAQPLLRTITPEVPTLESGGVAMQGGDIEEGNMVTDIVAHAELVEDDRLGNSNVSMVRDVHDQRRWRKKVICLLAFIGVVLAVGVALASVFATKEMDEDNDYDDKIVKSQGNKPNKPCSFGGSRCRTTSSSKDGDSPGWKGVDRDGSDDEYVDDNDDNDQTVELENDSTEEERYDNGNQPDIVEETNSTQVWRSYNPPLKKQWRGWHHDKSFLSDAVRGGSLSSFSVILEDTEFVCTSQENLF